MWVGSIKRCIPEIKIINLIEKGKSLKTVFGIVISVPKIHSEKLKIKICAYGYEDK